MEKTTKIKYNQTEKMGKMPIGKLLFSMSLPAIFAMLIQALYNIVDSIYVSRITEGSEAEITALNYAFPLQMIMMAFAFGVGIGTNSLIARRLGEKKADEASNAAKTGFVLVLICYAAFLIFSFFLPQLFLKIYHIDSPEIKQMATSYLSIVMAFSFGMFLETTSNKILQSTGDMKTPMFTLLLGAVTNIILDPIFIFKANEGIGLPFGLGLGVTGAAIATVIAQIVAAIFALTILLFKKHAIKVDFKPFKIHKQTVAEIIRVGISVTIMNSINAITTIILNTILTKSGVTVLGVYFKIQSFIFMPVFGLTQGALPILGYNYGAKEEHRFRKTFFYAISFALAIMVIGLVLFQTIPGPILGMFDLSSSLDLGMRAIRIMSICFIPAALSIVISTMFQAIGHGVKSMLMSLARQLIILIPCAIIIKALTHTDDYVWWSYPIAEIACCAVFIPIALLTIKKIFIKQRAEMATVTE